MRTLQFSLILTVSLVSNTLWAVCEDFVPTERIAPYERIFNLLRSKYPLGTEKRFEGRDDLVLKVTSEVIALEFYAVDSLLVGSARIYRDHIEVEYPTFGAEFLSVNDPKITNIDQGLQIKLYKEFPRPSWLSIFDRSDRTSPDEKIKIFYTLILQVDENGLLAFRTYNWDGPFERKGDAIEWVRH